MWRAARSGGSDVIRGRMVVLMGWFWFNVLGFVVVFIIVFALVAACERERH